MYHMFAYIILGAMCILIIGAVIGVLYIIKCYASMKARIHSARRMMHHYVCKEHHLTWVAAVPGISYEQAKELYYIYEKMKVKYQAMNAAYVKSHED